MIPIRRLTFLEGVLLIAIVAGAAGVRYWYLTACCSQALSDGPVRVQDEAGAERDALVRSLKEGHGFTGKAPLAAAEEATAHVGIGYPWLLALLYRTTDDLDVAYQRARWIQAALGALTAGLYFLVVRRGLRNLAAATLAGVLCAVYPFWVANTAEVADGVLATFLVALCLFLGVRGGQGGGALTSLVYGAALAGLALVRAVLFPFSLVAILWFLWRCRRLVHGWSYALLALVGFVVSLVPWSIRNYQTYQDAVPIADSGFYHWWIGNNPRATGGPMSDAAVGQTLGEGRTQQLGQVRQPARYRELAGDAWREIRDNPAGTFQRRLRALVGFCMGDQWLENGQLYRDDPAVREGVPDWLSRSAPALFAGSLFFVLLGGFIGWRWSYGWRFEAMPSSLAPFWIAIPYIVSHAERLSGPRLPLDGVLLCYLAFTIIGLIPVAGSPLARRVELDEVR